MATTATTRVNQATAFTPTLFLACELGVNTWKRGFTTGAAQRPRERHVPAGDGQTVLEEIRRAKSRVGLREEAPVVSCYEAGREGFGRHRFFGSQGVAHAGVDSASMEVKRRDRWAQTARLDVHKLLTRLRRHAAGEKKVWRVVRVPSGVEEDRRQLQRELLTTKRERTRVINRLKGRLAGCGIRIGLQGEVATQLAQVRPGDGTPLPLALRARLQREGQTVQLLTAQIGRLEAERRVALRTSAAPVMEQVRQLTTLRGIGVKSAWWFAMECFAWRDLQPPQPVGALAGLTPTPDQSGQASRELGMTQAGNGSMRPMAIEMAGGGGRFQPESLLTQWYQARVGQGSARRRTMGMVALARKVLIALWRFLKTGELPAGAALKAAVSGEPVPEDKQRPRRGTTVLGWCGELGAGHGCAGRTEYEEGLPTPGFPGAQSACRIGCVTQRGHHGEQVVWSQCAPRITKPPAQVWDTLPLGRPQGPVVHAAGKTIKRA